MTGVSLMKMEMHCEHAFQFPIIIHDKDNGLNSMLPYKFTIAENTPLEEIAVDPEMLGRIFEALAEQAMIPKSSTKNAGALYSRPVVSYMCKVLCETSDTEITPENSKTIIHKLLKLQYDPAAAGASQWVCWKK